MSAGERHHFFFEHGEALLEGLQVVVVRLGVGGEAAKGIGDLGVGDGGGVAFEVSAQVVERKGRRGGALGLGQAAAVPARTASRGTPDSFQVSMSAQSRGESRKRLVPRARWK